MAQPPIYPPPAQPQVPPKKSNTVLWVVIILGVGALCVFGLLIGAAILFPVFSQARYAAQRTACLSKVKQQAAGLLMYAAENDDHFPPAKSWMDKIADYTSGDSAFRCPTATKDLSPEAYGYGFNGALSQIVMGKVKSPEKTVAIFESLYTTRNTAGGEETVMNPGRHTPNRGNNFGYVDGSAKFVKDGELAGSWKP